jgi:quercetin dioxygenase-like cupin family protein
MREHTTVLLAALLVAAAVAAQDPAEVDSKHYQVVTDNEHVRVLRITYGPGEKSVLHEHPDAVAVMLTDHRVRFHTPDGKSEEVSAGAGAVLWTPGGLHLPENVGAEPLEVILVEFKPGGAKGIGSIEPAFDPVKLSPEHYKLELENDRVRVVRIRYDPGHRSELHMHGPRLGVWLTDARLRHYDPEGQPGEIEVYQKGQAGFSGEVVKHSGENLGEADFEVILVELKPR